MLPIAQTEGLPDAPAGDFEAGVIRRAASGGFFQASCTGGAAPRPERSNLSNYITGPTSEPDAERRRPEE